MSDDDGEARAAIAADVREYLEMTEQDILRESLGRETPGWPSKWGWVTYRTAFAPELDAGWAALQHRILNGMATYVDNEEYDEDVPFADDISSKRDFVFVDDDPARLQGASRQVLRRDFFQPWAVAQVPPRADGRAFRGGGSRYDYFLHADEDALRSLLGLPNAAGTARYPPYVNIVQGWAYEPPPADDPSSGHRNQDEAPAGPNDQPFNPDEGPMDQFKLALGTLSVSEYTGLDCSDLWYVLLRSAPVDYAAVRM